MNAKPRLLVVGDAVATTGFARVLHAILERLESRYEIHHLGINYRGDPHTAGWRIYPASLDSDVFGVRRLRSLVERIQPDIMFLVYDLWVLARYAEVLEPFAGRIPTIMYFPVDGAPVEPSMVHKLAHIDELVAYTRFGKRVVEEALELSRRANAPTRDIAIIPHGLDTRMFAPLDARDETRNRQLARRQLFPDRPELWDAFIVLNANRNQPRKRIDATMEGFAAFARDKPENVKLMLHMGIEDEGWNILALARRLDLEERLIVTTDAPSIPSVPVAQLNLIYNACDVGLNTSIGEGWGLVSFEHAATRAAQIVPRHSACEELWQGAAEFLEPAFSLTQPKVLFQGHYVMARDVAVALDRVYGDASYRAQLREAAYANALRQEYGWERIAETWHQLFQRHLDRARPRPGFESARGIANSVNGRPRRPSM